MNRWCQRQWPFTGQGFFFYFVTMKSFLHVYWLWLFLLVWKVAGQLHSPLHHTHIIIISRWLRLVWFLYGCTYTVAHLCFVQAVLWMWFLLCVLHYHCRFQHLCHSGSVCFCVFIFALKHAVASIHLVKASVCLVPEWYWCTVFAVKARFGWSIREFNQTTKDCLKAISLGFILVGLYRLINQLRESQGLPVGWKFRPVKPHKCSSQARVAHTLHCK